MIDFPTALARLLKDGARRDAFAADPGSALADMELSPADRDALLRLDFAELEAQADVLLRKRLDQVARWLPVTCARAGWPEFRACARKRWPHDELDDALAFAWPLANTSSAGKRRHCFRGNGTGCGSWRNAGSGRLIGRVTGPRARRACKFCSGRGGAGGSFSSACGYDFRAETKRSTSQRSRVIFTSR